MAVHPATGHFIWFNGPFANVADIKMFNEGGFARNFYDEEEDKFTGLGVADKGYSSKNETLDSTRALLTPIKKVRGQHSLPLRDKKYNQVLSSVRIEVERSIGRLKCFGRLCAPFRGKASSLDERKRKHYALFYVAIHLTNMWIKLHPLRQEPNWLLCLDGIDSTKVREVVRAFMDSPHQDHLKDFLEREYGGIRYVQANKGKRRHHQM